MTDKNSTPPEIEAFLNDIEENKPPEKYYHTNLKELVDALNKKVALVNLGRNKLFASKDEKGQWIFRTKSDAEIEFAKYQYEGRDKNGDPKQPVPGLREWLKSPRRKEYERVVFAPGRKKDKSGELNLWGGWAVTPGKGDCPLLLGHILDNICQGDKDNYHFLMSVLAQMFQEPERKIGICIGLQGEFGVGKTKLSDWLGHIIGPLHAPVIDKPDQLTGRFTGQLEYALLARVEEGFYPGDPVSKAAIKHITTSKQLLVERKGVDAYNAENFTRLFITSNSDWVVPAGAGERRYFILKVGNARKQDGKFFGAIDEQMENGGAEGFLHFLLTYDYSDVDFTKLPMTASLQEQIRLGFTPEEKWWETTLAEGAFPFKDLTNMRGEVRDATWQDGQPVKLAKTTVLESFRDSVPGYRSPPSMQALGTFLAKNVPGIAETKDRDGVRFWKFPDLATLRTAFIGRRPGYEFLADPVIEEAGEVLPFNQRHRF